MDLYFLIGIFIWIWKVKSNKQKQQKWFFSFFHISNKSINLCYLTPLFLQGITFSLSQLAQINFMLLRVIREYMIPGINQTNNKRIYTGTLKLVHLFAFHTCLQTVHFTTGIFFRRCSHLIVHSYENKKHWSMGVLETINTELFYLPICNT